MTFYQDHPYLPYYGPDPWHTTCVPRHFPERHFPLEHFRHSVGHTLSNVAGTIVHPLDGGQPTLNPSIDVRESKTTYYIDIELPGLDNVDKLRIRWSNSRTLLLETGLQRPEVDEAGTGGAGTTSGTTATSDATVPAENQSENGSRTDGKEDVKGKDIALTVHERRIGSFARAFNFPTKVSHEGLDARLHAGLLRLTVPKVEAREVKEEHKEVNVKHSGA